MITYPHEPQADDVVVTVRMSKKMHTALERLAVICAERQGTEVDEDDIPDLVVQAVEHALGSLSEDFKVTTEGG